MHDSSAEEFSTPRMRIDGEGDGVRNVAGSRSRVLAPSCRKFSARAPRDDKMKTMLERAVEEIRGAESGARRRERSCCAAVKRARTVAEITPTRMKIKKRLAKPSGAVGSVAQLHATPRPLDDAPSASPRRAAEPPRPCRRPDAFCRTYERLLLMAWRRQRGRMEESVEKCEKYRTQISQLEVQVDFLKTMRNSECEKRDEALSECQLMRKKNDLFEAENSHLIEEMKVTQQELANVKKNFKLAKCDLKRSAEQVAKLQDQLRKKKEEKMDLLSKLSAHEQEITCQTSTIIGLKEKLKITEMNLHNSQVNLGNKQEALEEMIQHLRSEVEINSSLKEEVAALKETETDLENHSKYLEDRLEEYVSRCEELDEENASVRRDLRDTSLELGEERKKWYRNTKELALCSLGALRVIAMAFLPPDYREY